MLNLLLNFNKRVERLFLAIEDTAARAVHRAIALVISWRHAGANETATVLAAGDIDAELGRETRNPLRGWRWV